MNWKFWQKNPASTVDLTVEQLTIYRNRGAELRMRHPVFAKFTDEMCIFFEETGAINNLELTVFSERYGKMNVLIQRAEGETPAQQNMQLREKIKELEDENAHLKEELFSY